jgi:hypothetical protein
VYFVINVNVYLLKHENTVAMYIMSITLYGDMNYRDQSVPECATIINSYYIAYYIASGYRKAVNNDCDVLR